ncbi:hypothetical protein GUJ93_ZPchr0657g29115 [Zizania palustris]|uniref:UspA domain-containing protein n=1 Tax=Zizania palustris TaxID=103762 RepID=A0A8J5R460_ZIZPA|nr:hypothetical protein GUJ93_ZPchr0657g29115 [Zizania palustris]
MMEADLDAFTTSVVDILVKTLNDVRIPYKIHIMKDHDMKEKLCLEVERLGLSAVIMGSKGFGTTRQTSNRRLGSMNDYCVHHCVCPVVVVCSNEDGVVEDAEAGIGAELAMGEEVLHPMPKEDAEYHDATEEHKGYDISYLIDLNNSKCCLVRILITLLLIPSPYPWPQRKSTQELGSSPEVFHVLYRFIDSTPSDIEERSEVLSNKYEKQSQSSYKTESQLSLDKTMDVILVQLHARVSIN